MTKTAKKVENVNDISLWFLLGAVGIQLFSDILSWGFVVLISAFLALAAIVLASKSIKNGYVGSKPKVVRVIAVIWVVLCAANLILLLGS